MRAASSTARNGKSAYPGFADFNVSKKDTMSSPCRGLISPCIGGCLVFIQLENSSPVL
jgi:hypothetical protein